MVDMSQFVAPKSDQLNADDLIAGPRTITVTRVSANEGSPEQPISIYFEGDNGKPYKPCKSMRRVMIGVWGADAGKYVGRSMTIYRDPAVAFGGMQVGGIRVSHMSHLEEKKTMALTATRAQRKPFTVLPLANAPAPAEDAAARWANGYIAKLQTFTTIDALLSFEAEKAAKLAELQSMRPDLHASVTAAAASRKAELSPASGGFEDDFGAPAAAPTVSYSLADQIADRPGETPEGGGNNAEAMQDDTTHPGTAIADAIIAEINKPETNAIMDVAGILNRSTLDLASMLDEDAVRVEIAADKRRAEIRAAQAKAKELAE